MQDQHSTTGIARLKGKFSAQSKKARATEVSTAVIVVGALAFGLTLFGSPTATDAETPAMVQVNPLHLEGNTKLPLFEERYQRHLGVLEVLPR